MTEKNQQEQNAAQRQIELLSAALTRAKENDGLFLNPQGKKAPALYPKLLPASPFNALSLALHSDEKGYRTNLYTQYFDAKKHGDSVEVGEKGVPYVWYNWKDNVRTKEVRTLFNLEQTTFPIANKAEFEKSVRTHGPSSARGETVQDEKELHMAFNRFIDDIKKNLVQTGKDRTGVAHYDARKDIVFIPAQKNYPDYSDYVQDVIRQLVTATGQPQRLGRSGTVSADHTPSNRQQQHERLIVELASSIKMMQFGLPAKISGESMADIDVWKTAIETNPRLLDAIEYDVNKALGMIQKAENGQKIELKEIPQQDETVGQNVNAKVQLLQGDDKRWMLFIKPEKEESFVVYPEKEDVGRFFAAAKKNAGDVDTARQALAQKYYSRAMQHPEIKAGLLDRTPEDVDQSKIQKVSIFKSKGDNPKILCYINVEGQDKVPPREVSPFQWQKMWLADDKEAYKKTLAANLFQDILRQKNEERQQEFAREQAEEKQRNSPEQKAKDEREEKAKEESTRMATNIIGAVVGAGIANEVRESHGYHR